MQALLNCKWMAWRREQHVGGEAEGVQICALARPARQKYACTPIPLSIFTPHEYSLGTKPPQLPNPRWRLNMIILCTHTTLHLSYISGMGTRVYDTITYFSHRLCRTPQYSVGVANHSESPGPMLIFIA